MVYLGSINLYFYLYSTFWDTLAGLGLARPLERRNEPKRIMQEMVRMQEAKRKTMKEQTVNGFYKDPRLNDNVATNGAL